MRDRISCSTFSWMCIGIILPFCCNALNSFRNVVCTIWLRALPILVHKPGYDVFTQLVIFWSEHFVSSEIALLTYQLVFVSFESQFVVECFCLRYLLFCRPPLSVNVSRVHPPDSIGVTTLPNDGILYPL